MSYLVDGKAGGGEYNNGDVALVLTKVNNASRTAEAWESD